MVELTRTLAIVTMMAASIAFCAELVEQEEDTEMGGRHGGPDQTLPIPGMDAAAPTETKTATFALGCFWSPDGRFGSIGGVVRTRVGYAGGKNKNPTYYNLGDHMETVQIEYDPAKISYGVLLDIFWSSHDPRVRASSRQYASAVFYHDHEQKKLALESREREAARSDTEVFTEILPATDFCPAEAYHQKYRLRQHREIMREFRAIYPDDERFVASTAVARVNGYLSGYGSSEQLEKELDSLGLSAEGRKRLSDIVSSTDTPGDACGVK